MGRFPALRLRSRHSPGPSIPSKKKAGGDARPVSEGSLWKCTLSLRPEDGTGADWRLMLESLYRAGFNIADEQLDDDARRKIMRRVHEGPTCA